MMVAVACWREQRGGDATLSDVLALIAVAVSICTAWYAWSRDRWRHAGAVTVDRTFVTGTIDEHNHNEVIVRNDGVTAVKVENVSIAYGSWYALDRSRPEYWQFVSLRAYGMLRPGEEMRLAEPDQARLADPVLRERQAAGEFVSGVPGVLGPVVVITDTEMRRWMITALVKRRLPGNLRRPRRRDLRFERSDKWRPRLEAAELRALERMRKHPTRLPVQAVVLDALWGWRPGRADGPGPLNRPLAWTYGISDYDAGVPDIDLMPTYSWRRDPDPMPPPPKITKG